MYNRGQIYFKIILFLEDECFWKKYSSFLDFTRNYERTRWNFFPLYKKKISYLFPCKQWLLPSADNLCKEFGPRSGLTKQQSSSEFKQLDTEIVLLKEFFEKLI